MGRWVTSKGRRIYIPDEGEKVPEKYKKSDSKSSFTRSQNHEISNLQNEKERVSMLEEQLKKHPNDEHTKEIKSRLKKAKQDYDKLSKGNTSDSNFKTDKEWDTKEKQISANKAQADERNGKKIRSDFKTDAGYEAYKKSGHIFGENYDYDKLGAVQQQMANNKTQKIEDWHGRRSGETVDEWKKRERKKKRSK